MPVENPRLVSVFAAKIDDDESQASVLTAR